MNREEIESTLSNKELSKVCNKVIDFIGTFNLNLATKYLVVKHLYESFIETCQKEGYSIMELEKEKVSK